jgi:hypothetical protein
MAGSEERGKGRRRRKAGGKKKSTGGDSGKPYGEADVISGLNHLLRREALRLLHSSDEPRSPVRAAEKLKHPLSMVSYHFTVLARLKIIAPAGEAQARGAMEHFYVSNAAEDRMMLDLLQTTREADEELMRERTNDGLVGRHARR